MMSMSPGDIQDFERYEFKYLLSPVEREVIEDEVRNFMRYDGHVDPTMDNQYLVRSLYFDTPAASNFYEKIDGIRSRQKFRLRTYADNPKKNAPLFLEIKGRHNERTYKHRVEIQHDDLPLFAGGEVSPSLLERYQGNSVVEGYVFGTLRNGLRPKVLVDYLRRPYTSDYDMNFRVTFDASVQAVASDCLYRNQLTGNRRCVADHTILEIKFNRRIPAWFHRILQAHEMQRLSISKFVVGMKVCNLAVDLS